MQGTSHEAIVAFNQDFLQDLHSVYTRLRQEAPVHRAVTPMGLSTWLVTRYEDARALLADSRLSKDMRDSGRLFARHRAHPDDHKGFNQELVLHMLNSDPPDHTRLRRLVSKAFAPGRVEALRPRVEAITTELLDHVVPGQETNLLDALASPLPIMVLFELFGVPHDDRDNIRAPFTILTSVGYSAQQVKDASIEMAGHLHRLIADKRANPGADLLSALVEARDNDDRLDEDELTSTVFLLLFVGHESTVNLIGNGVFALLRHPDQLAALRADRTLLPGAIEEILRYESPVNIATWRHTTEPVQVGEVTIPEEEFVFISVWSANRDPERFPDADRLDITRPAGGHVTFGHGIHYCLGAPLARLQAEVAFGALLDRFPSWELATAPENLAWRFSVPFHTLETLPVRLR